MTTTLYGIANCDTVRRARRWMDARNLSYRFHDFRADGLDTESVASWLEQLGWETLINRRSSSWKALTAAERERMDDALAAQSILASPTLIKRPLLEHGEVVEVGFSAERYTQLFGT